MVASKWVRGGQIGRLKNNQLVYARPTYFARRFAVVVVDADINLARGINFVTKIKRLVTEIASRRGTLRAQRARAARRADFDVGISNGCLGKWPERRQYSRYAEAMLKTPVIHHPDEGCKFTLPAGVAPFIKWARGKAQVVWRSGGSAGKSMLRLDASRLFRG